MAAIGGIISNMFGAVFKKLWSLYELTQLLVALREGGIEITAELIRTSGRHI